MLLPPAARPWIDRFTGFDNKWSSHTQHTDSPPIDYHLSSKKGENKKQKNSTRLQIFLLYLSPLWDIISIDRWSNESPQILNLNCCTGLHCAICQCHDEMETVLKAWTAKRGRHNDRFATDHFGYIYGTVPAYHKHKVLAMISSESQMLTHIRSMAVSLTSILFIRLVS